MSIRRYSAIETIDAPEVNSILFPAPAMFRWCCDHCRIHRRCHHGRWTESESTANDEADVHDDMHERERQYREKGSAHDPR